MSTRARDIVRRRPDAAVVVVACAFMSFTLFTSFTASQQQSPVFRTRVDLMQLDVTVLDAKGVPVRGLKREDFELFEDKQQQKIEGFTAIDLPERDMSGPPWRGKVAADVATNEFDNARLFVLVIDDGMGMQCCTSIANAKQFPDPGAIRNMKKTAELFVNSMGPQDLAAVVFTGTTAKFSQNLTSDRARLIKAINAYPASDGTLILDPGKPPPGSKPIPQCMAAKEILRLIEAAVLQLASLPDRRKSLLYFGGSVPWASIDCGVKWMWDEIFVAAQQGSVTINPIQTAGLVASVSGIPPVSYEPYKAIAGNTGGYAVVNTNDFAPGVKRIFQESSSYYLLAYQPSRDIADGTFRRITVRVKNRPDVEIVTKRNYWAPRQRPADEPPPPEPSEQIKALSGILPDSKLKLRAAAVPFPIAGTDRAVIALAVGIKQPAFAGRTTEQVELLIRSFTTTGDPKAGDTQTIPITVPAPRADVDVSKYEVLARIEVAKPGNYHLRLSALSTASNTRGSVYVDVEVPDFKKDKVSLSGVVVNALPAMTLAPPRLLNDLTSLAPTSERQFGVGDLVTAMMRVYQGTEKPSPVAMKVRILDGGGVQIFEATATIGVDTIGKDGGAPYQFRIPFAELKGSGLRDYLMTFQASVGRNTASRDVTFQVK